MEGFPPPAPWRLPRPESSLNNLGSPLLSQATAAGPEPRASSPRPDPVTRARWGLATRGCRGDPDCRRGSRTLPAVPSDSGRRAIQATWDRYVALDGHKVVKKDPPGLEANVAWKANDRRCLSWQKGIVPTQTGAAYSPGVDGGFRQHDMSERWVQRASGGIGLSG